MRRTGEPRRGVARSAHLVLEVEPGCGVNGSMTGGERRGASGCVHGATRWALLLLRLRGRCGSRIRIRTLQVQPACGSRRNVCALRWVLHCFVAQQLRCDAVAATRLRGPRRRSRPLQRLLYLRLR